MLFKDPQMRHHFTKHLAYTKLNIKQQLKMTEDSVYVIKGHFHQRLLDYAEELLLKRRSRLRNKCVKEMLEKI